MGWFGLYLTVNVPDLAAPFAVAETFTNVDALTAFVTTEKAACVEPAATVTPDGILFTAVAPLSTASETVVFPLTGAGNVTFL